MEEAPNDNVNAICRMIAGGCREHLARALAVLHMSRGAPGVAEDTLMSALIAADNDLKALERWLDMAPIVALPENDENDEMGEITLAAAVELREAPQRSYTAPGSAQIGQPRSETFPIAVHPPPQGWEEKNQTR